MKAFYQASDEELEALSDEMRTQLKAGFSSPSIRGVTVERYSTKKLGASAKAAGSTLQAAGTGMQATGRGMRTGGLAAARAGAALSATGAGAIVGVPLAAVGTGVAAAGTGVEVGGRVTRQVGKNTSRAGKALKKGPDLSIQTVKKTVKAGRVAFMVGQIGGWLWLFLQLPLAIFNIALLALADMGDRAFNASGLIGKVLGFAANVVSNASEFLFGVNLGEMAAGTIQGLFTGIGFIVFIIGLTTLLIGAMMFQLSGINCLSGRGAGLKLGMFLLALIGYLFPFLNLFPWGIFWLLAVVRYPK